MIIVTGIGRCGTSLVIKWLKECNFKIGADKWFDTMSAGLENKHTIDINQRLIRHYVKGEKINLHHVRGDIEELAFDAVKDTQFLTHPAIIKEWASVKDISVIWMHRDPEQIVRSMRKMPEWNSPVYRLFPDLIKQKCDEFMKSLNDNDIPWAQYMFPQILDNPDILIDDIDGLPKNALSIWNDMIDDKKHL